MTKDVIAAIDIGGTKIALGLADLDGPTMPFRRLPTRIEQGPHRILEEAVAELEKMAAESSARPVAVGIGCGGPLDRRRGVILSPPNLPGWDEFPIVDLLAERLAIPACLDNDANAAALGENLYGAGRNLRHMAYLTVSTGIGGALIVNGDIVHGVADGAGEIGHMTVLPDGPPCGCGARGCLEAICSGTSIARRARERLAAGARSTLAEAAGGDARKVTAKHVAECAAAGDEVAAELWDETVHYLAIGVANVIAVLAPEAVVIGGGVSTAGDQLFVPLREKVLGRVKMFPPEKIRVLQAELSGDSGIHGALILGRREHALKRVHGSGRLPQ